MLTKKILSTSLNVILNNSFSPTTPISNSSDLLRLKSLKSVRRHNRDKKTIVLKEEEEEEVEEPPKTDEDMVAVNVHHHEEKPSVDWVKSKEAR